MRGLRSALIEKNFNTNDPQVISVNFSLREVTWIELSQLTAQGFARELTSSKLTFRQCVKMTLWTTAFAIYIVALLSCPFAAFHSAIAKLYLEVIGYCIMTGVSLIVLSLLLMENPTNSFNYVVDQEIRSSSSSMKSVDLTKLSNQLHDEGIEDPITFDVYPKEQIRSPGILKIGAYAIGIRNVLRAMLGKYQREETLPHPIEGRALTNEEHEKIVSAICAFFSIAPASFVECWQYHQVDGVAVLGQQVADFGELDDEDQAYYIAEWESAQRLVLQQRAFLRLIPQTILGKYFGAFNTEDAPLPDIAEEFSSDEDEDEVDEF